MRRTRSRLPSVVSIGLAILPLLALPPACGGALSANLEGKGDSGGAGSGSGGSGGSSGAGSSSSGASPDSGSGGSDASQGVVDAVATVDVINPPESADVTPVEEPMPSGPTVLCPANGNPVRCAAGEFCCVVGDAQSGGTQTDTCESAGTSCAGTPVQCASAADCPGGQVCCGTEQTEGGVLSYTDVVCATSCNGASKRTFCDPAASTCPASRPTCALSTLMPGYSVCQ